MYVTVLKKSQELLEYSTAIAEMITSTTDAVKSQAGKREDQVAVGKFHLSIVYILNSIDLRRTLRSLQIQI